MHLGALRASGGGGTQPSSARQVDAMGQCWSAQHIHVTP